ncbi:hypothetical protein ETQ85_19070 [Zoogloea oleivorans]|uniref:Uncharacterized protein n=1 Tax=Zoogloea oleivorans TaxID=1552750 RepID=A0A6C2CM77_9RHOO|nr:hypothetical protein ETQ85_19070 [Zoogloea oleivorans]
MHYVYLGLAIACEVVATSALKNAEGFSRLVPSLIVAVGYGAAFFFLCKRPATPSPPGSPNSVFVSTPNDVDTNTLQFLLNSASAYACPAVGQ